MSRAFAVITGNLTKDPEAGKMPDGAVTSRFDLAVNDKVKGEDVVTFFRVNLIGRQAEVANQYLSKGRETQVEGTIRLSQFTRNDGTPGASIEVRGTNVTLLRGEGKQEAKAASASASAEPDNVPF